VAAFFVVFSPYGVTAVVAIWYDGVEKNRGIYFPLVALTKLTMPSTGCWNAFCFIRPRLYQLRIRDPDASSIQLLRKIIFNVMITPEAPLAARNNIINNNKLNADFEEQKRSSSSRSQRSVEENDYTPELILNDTTEMVPLARVLPRQRELLETNGTSMNEDVVTEDEHQENSSSSCTAHLQSDAATAPVTG